MIILKEEGIKMKMGKIRFRKITALLISAALLTGSLGVSCPAAVNAENDGAPSVDVEENPGGEESTQILRSPETVSSGTLKEGMTWTLDSEGVLKINGSGVTPDYEETPFSEMIKDGQIRKVIIGEGITEIGKNLLNCGGIVTHNDMMIHIPPSLTKVNENGLYIDPGDYVVSFCVNKT